MAVLFLVLATRNLDSEVLVVAGLDDGWVEIRVGGKEFKPAVEDVLVRVGFFVAPFGVSRLGDVDVGYFAYFVLAGVCTTNFYIEGIAAVATGDDDGLLSELAERRKLILCRHESFFIPLSY